MKTNENEILTIAGKKVVVRYARTPDAACASCSFCDRKECHDLDCNMRDIIGESVSKYAYFAEPWIRCSDCALFLGGKCTRPGGECARKAPLSEEIHSLQEWAKIMAEHPELRAEFDKMCPPQPIQGSIAPEADVDKWVVTNAFLHCEKAGKIVSEMYGDKFNNQRNRNKYLAFLQQVNLDDRFGELARILQRYGAMPAPKEQPEADLEAEIDRFYGMYRKDGKTYDIKDDEVCADWKEMCNPYFEIAFARHFAEWERKRTLDKVVEWMKANLTYTHPRKGVETCMVNIPAFLDTMNEENT